MFHSHKKMDPYVLEATNYYPAAFKLLAKYDVVLKRFGLDPEDMAQRIILRLWQIQDRYNPNFYIEKGISDKKIKATTYAHRIIKTFIASIVNNEKRKMITRQGTTEYNNQDKNTVSDNLYRGGTSTNDYTQEAMYTEEKLGEMEYLEALKTVCAKLPQKHQTALRLKLDGYSYKEIEYKLGYEKDTVRVIFDRIRRVVRKVLVPA